MNRRAFFKTLSVMALAGVLKGRKPEIWVGPIREGQPVRETYSQSYYEPPRGLDIRPFYR